MPSAIQLVLLHIFYLWLCCWYCSIVAQVLLLSLFFLCVLFVFCWCWNNLFFAGRTQCTISRATTTTTTTQVSLSLEELEHLRGPAIIQGALAPMIIPIIHPGWTTFFCKWWESQGLKHNLRHMIFSLWIWELPRSKVPPRSNSAGRRGGQNTPHRAESPWQVRREYFSIYLLFLYNYILFDAVVVVVRRQTKYSTRMFFADDGGLFFFHIFVAVAVFHSYFDFVVVGQSLLGRW